MQIGFIGLGRMGKNMVQRLLQNGHQIVAWNRSPQPLKDVEMLGATPATTVEELIQKLPSPKVVWIMLPSGETTENMVKQVSKSLKPGDIIIEGGNSNYKDSIRRAEEARKQGLHYLDVGTSGGIWGLKVGYCIMIGGEEIAYKKLEPIFKSLAPENGYLHVGPSGSGHFVKMIHNGIEYGMMQAIGEGFEIMNASGFNLDFEKISRLWNQGSVVRSWLMELAERAFANDAKLSNIADYVEDSGEGRWTVFEAIEKNVHAPVITLSLLARLRSRQEESFGAKVLAALRNEFGGHAIKAK